MGPSFARSELMIDPHSPNGVAPKIEIRGEQNALSKSVLTEPAIAFLAELHRRFEPTRQSLLKRRIEVLHDLQKNIYPVFDPKADLLRESDWQAAPIPNDLLDRRVEITGPVDRKMVINALNSGANVYMADFEDSHSPTWRGTLEGQVNLKDAVNRTIEYTSPEGKRYILKERTATLFVRPRGWHLFEKNLYIDGQPISASLFDFGLFFFRNAEKMIDDGKTPCFYLPKMESHLEAKLWNDVFIFSQERIGIPRGTIRATVLIETILAAFEMDEIIHELREHSAGLNCGRWDYIFSFIKKFSHNQDFILPDRTLVTMESPFLKAYSDLLIQRCHKRKIHAMGGMAAQIPIKNDLEANRAAMAKVRADKEREARAGNDGTWVAHPALVPLAKTVFDSFMAGPNQIMLKPRREVSVDANNLLEVPKGIITRGGFRSNINIALLYLEAWLGGLGCVPLYNLMEDAATAEISRAQIWQWIRNDRGCFEDGTKITLELFESVLDEELAKAIKAQPAAFGKLEIAAKILRDITRNDDFTEFLTLPAYQYLK
jgi:malate synthase